MRGADKETALEREFAVSLLFLRRLLARQIVGANRAVRAVAEGVSELGREAVSGVGEMLVRQRQVGAAVHGPEERLGKREAFAARRRQGRDQQASLSRRILQRPHEDRQNEQGEALYSNLRPRHTDVLVWLEGHARTAELPDRRGLVARREDEVIAAELAWLYLYETRRAHVKRAGGHPDDVVHLEGGIVQVAAHGAAVEEHRSLLKRDVAGGLEAQLLRIEADLVGQQPNAALEVDDVHVAAEMEDAALDAGVPILHFAALGEPQRDPRLLGLDTPRRPG